MRPPASLFFLCVMLAMWDALRFHMNFKMVSAVSAKDGVGVLVGILGSLGCF